MKKILIVMTFAVLTFMVKANNIQITTTPVILQDLFADNVLKVRFDLSWENSWCSGDDLENYDAAWVFIKYRVRDGDWKHAYLKDLPSHTIGIGSYPLPDDMQMKMGSCVTSQGETKNSGIFIYRNQAQSKGDNTLKEVILHWDIAGLEFTDKTMISVRVFAVEMVYVTQGPFYAGDGVSPLRLNKVGSVLTETSPTNTTDIEISVADLGSRINKVSLATQVSSPANMFSLSSGVWSSSSAADWKYIQYEFPSAQAFTSMLVRASNTAGGNSPKGMVLAASNDGIDWINITGSFDYIDGNNESLMFANGQYSGFAFGESAAPFLFYRLYLHGGTMSISGVQFFTDDADNFIRLMNDSAIDYLKADGTRVTVPRAFPKGTQGFFIMKHELSQHAWVDFLNTLTIEQQHMMSPNGMNAFTEANTLLFPGMRNHIRVRTPSDEQDPALYGNSVNGSNWDFEENGGSLPMTNLNWFMVSSYLDWASLRPLTELEYEKACRGYLRPLPYEYAWGDTTKILRSDSVKFANQSKEDSWPDSANYVLAGANGDIAAYTPALEKYFPMRVGIFAKKPRTRIQAGAGIWGALNLSDNVAELYITMSNPIGRSFVPAHGDGTLEERGAHNVVGWPLPDAIEGLGYKGIAARPDAGLVKITGLIPVSDRRYVATQLAEMDKWTGLRGGRSVE